MPTTHTVSREGAGDGFLTAEDVLLCLTEEAVSHQSLSIMTVEVAGAHGKIQPAARIEVIVGGDTATGPVLRISAFPAEDHDPARRPVSRYEETAGRFLLG